MDDAKNFLLGVMQTLKDRFGNPLISSIVISWCLWNSQLLIILISTGDGGWKSKLDYINHTLYPTGIDRFIDFLLAPVVFAVIWIYLMPSLLSMVAIHHEKTFNKNRENLLKELEKKPISEEDKKILLDRMLKDSNSFQKEKETLSASYMAAQITISKLDERIANADNQVKEITSQKEQLMSDLQKSVDKNNELIMQLNPSAQIEDVKKIDEVRADEILQLLHIRKRIGNLYNPSDIVANKYINANYPIISSASFNDKSGLEIIKKNEAYDQEIIAFLLIMNNDANGATNSVTYDRDFYHVLEKYGVKNINNTINNLFSMNFISNVNPNGFVTTTRASLTGLFFSRLGFSLVLQPESTQSN